jgi:hypothetical protein
MDIIGIITTDIVRMRIDGVGIIDKKSVQRVEGPRIQVKSKKLFKERSPDFGGRGFIIDKGGLGILKKDVSEI